MNRLTRANYADGSYTTYTYDAVGRVVSITDSISGTISYTYTNGGCSTGGCSGGAADKVASETTPLGTINYTYDNIGRRTSMTVAGQPAVTYTYDAGSRLNGISSQIGGAATNFAITYDGLGRGSSIVLPNGVTTNYTYDIDSHLLNLQHLSPASQILESLGYTYDAVGNRISLNRQSITLPLPNAASNTSYNNANQMLTFNNQNITYDANGNMTSVVNACGTTTYTWDMRNRLVGISGFNTECSQLTASFEYDALGRRIQKTINGRTIQYVYDGMDIIQEIENGQVTANYVRTLSIDEPLVRIKSDGTVRYYQRDALGSVITLTDGTGTVQTTYTYDPFGNVTISGQTSDNPFQYTGRENDGTGLYYYRARYYSPQLQRFISEDPIRFEGGDVNFHAYVGNNPVNLLDPLGLENCTECHKPPPPPCITCHVPPKKPEPKFKIPPMKDLEWFLCEMVFLFGNKAPNVSTCPDPCGPGPGGAPPDQTI
jgi:RHS repeat-associated protein